MTDTQQTEDYASQVFDGSAPEPTLEEQFNDLTIDDFKEQVEALRMTEALVNEYEQVQKDIETLRQQNQQYEEKLPLYEKHIDELNSILDISASTVQELSEAQKNTYE